MSELKDTQKRLVELQAQLTTYNHDYHVLNAPRISDQEYDRLFRELVTLETLHPDMVKPDSPTQRVGSLGDTSFEKTRHKVPMLSLDNAFTPDELFAFFDKKEVLMVEPKVDGLSLELTYEDGKLVQAVTRGDGRIGENVTVNARTIGSIPLELSEPVTLRVRGEVYMTYTVLNELNEVLLEADEEPFANARNAASGSLRLKDPMLVHKRRLSFVAYGSPDTLPNVETHFDLTEYLEILGFVSVLMLPTKEDSEPLACETELLSVEDAAYMVERCAKLKDSLDLPVDGLVFKVMSRAKQRELGDGTRAPNWAVAYKYPPERKATKLNGITLSVGKTGKITPIAELETVNLSGTKVSRASLCNQDEIKRLQVDIGDMVLIEKSGEIIPKIVGLAKTAPDDKHYYQITPKCPSCESMLEKPKKMVDFFCRNPKCPEQVFAKLKHATSKECLDIDGCGKAMINDLISLGVTDLLGLFTIPEEKLNLKPAAKKKFLKGREAALKAPLWRKLHALNIEGFGRTICQEISARWSSLPAMLDNANDFAVLVSGGPDGVLYNSWLDYMEREADALDALWNAGFEFMDPESDSGVPQLLKGKAFVITGDLESGLRDEVVYRIEQQGGVVKSGVSKKVDFLVVGANAGRTKTEKAAKVGTTVITEKQLYQMMGEDEVPEVETTTEEL